MKTKVVEKSTALWGQFFNLRSPQIRTFHITWIAFFLCFFGWFGIAPLMSVVKKEFALNKEQVGNIIIASIGITFLARLIIGWLIGRIGPRITYGILLIVGSIPVMLIGLSNSYETFLLARLAIGTIGASFVITQYHTSVMFAPNIVGTANATSAGWGNLGAGVSSMLMPLVFAGFLAFGMSEFASWRWSMVIPGVALFIMGFAYYFLTQDYPEGNISEVKKKNIELSLDKVKSIQKKAFRSAIKDYRVWALFLIYGACFGIEITINNIAALYFQESFNLSLTAAGIIAGLFGAMNIFARTLGGVYSDKFGIKNGLKGRMYFLAGVLLLEGLTLMLFSQMTQIVVAVTSMIIFSIFVKMAQGATFAVVPFVNKKALGIVAGIVGAGGNMGAIAAGFVLREYEVIDYNIPLLIFGGVVIITSLIAVLLRFSEKAEKEASAEMQISLQTKQAQAEA